MSKSVVTVYRRSPNVSRRQEKSVARESTHGQGRQLMTPLSLTILPTYRCTAGCSQCCFQCSPRIRKRLDLETILARIDEAAATFPDLQLVVFSGGEVFTLKNDLYIAIERARAHGKLVRCVTNASWGRSVAQSSRTAASLKDCGCNEVNISTGKDHQEWVPFASVENASRALIESGIATLVTVEADAQDSCCVRSATESRVFEGLRLEHPELFNLQFNSWMPFNDRYSQRGPAPGLSALAGGCQQIFSNIVVTPDDELSACCGLTFEQVPELKAGSLAESSMEDLYEKSLEDFLKIWIHVDGPGEILRKLFGREVDSQLSEVRHICHACAVLYKSPAARQAIRTRFEEFVPDVLPRWHARCALRRVEHLQSTDQGVGREET